MKRLFYYSIIGLSIFEILNVYFIMPMPGSQRMDSINLAYFLYSWRWLFRTTFIVMIIAGMPASFNAKKKWIPIASLMAALTIAYSFNFIMTADKMFLQPEKVILKPKNENKVPGERLVIGTEYNGEAKAYPIEFLAYHHQVLDSIGGIPIIATYCSVCRTGRIYKPFINGRHENFRLVGMDHFNAMFEDATTGSWWRQSTGEAITGKLKGQFLPEVPSLQVTINKWFDLYPDGLIMQPDKDFIDEYDSLAKFEQGKSESHLTRTDSLSWKDKSWVIGVEINNIYKAYDWNMLASKRIINDTIGSTPFVLVLSADSASFSAYERPSLKAFSIQNDTLHSGHQAYFFSGKSLNDSLPDLKPIQAYQEFWHSWKTFQPNTQQYLIPEK